MSQLKIVPDLIDEEPGNTITVTYPNGKSVNLGSELTPTEVKDEPKVNWNADANKYHVLLMTDPDPAPEFREVKHWLVGNIKGSDLSTGEVFAEYRGSGPPKGTGLHRYIFLLFETSGKISFDEPPKTPNNSRANRMKFSTKNFIKKYT